MAVTLAVKSKVEKKKKKKSCLSKPNMWSFGVTDNASHWPAGAGVLRCYTPIVPFIYSEKLITPVQHT